MHILLFLSNLFLEFEEDNTVKLFCDVLIVH